MFGLNDQDFETPDLEAMIPNADTVVPSIEPPDVGYAKLKFRFFWAIALILILSLLMWLKKHEKAEQFYECEPLGPEPSKKNLTEK